MSLPPNDEQHCARVSKFLTQKARTMNRNIERVEDGMCADLARAALLEAAAILVDCAEQCELMPTRIEMTD